MFHTILLKVPNNNPGREKGTKHPISLKTSGGSRSGNLEILGNPSPATQNPDLQVDQLPAFLTTHQASRSGNSPKFPTFYPSVRDLLAWCDHQSHGHHLKCPLMCQVILLMVQKSGGHQLRLVVFPIIYIVLYIPGGAEFLSSTVPAYIPQNTIVKQRNLQKSGELLMALENSTKVEEMCFICRKNRNFNSCNM